MNKIPKCVQPSGKRFESFLGGGGGDGGGGGGVRVITKILTKWKKNWNKKFQIIKKQWSAKKGFFQC